MENGYRISHQTEPLTDISLLFEVLVFGLFSLITALNVTSSCSKVVGHMSDTNQQTYKTILAYPNPLIMTLYVWNTVMGNTAHSCSQLLLVNVFNCNLMYKIW